MRRIATHPGARGLLDDVATLAPPPGETLVLTHDLLVEGVHYLPDDPPADVAWKLVAVNLSDLAAKGARPLGGLLGYRLGEPDWDATFADGLAAALERFALPLLGGDTVAGPGPRTLGLTAIGTAMRVPDRRGAQAGDGLWISGTIGDAGLGLRIARGDPSGDRDGSNGREPTLLPSLQGRGRGWVRSWSEQRPPHADPPPTPPFQGGEALDESAQADVAALLSAYRRPVPRLDIGAAVAAVAHATADMSDGLLIDTARIAEASGLAVTIDLDAVPLSDALRAATGDDRSARLAAATAGDDYQILAAAPPDAAATLTALGLARIGGFAAGTGLSLHDRAGPIPLPARLGFEHDRYAPGT